jgi:predicted metal-dependent RNase
MLNGGPVMEYLKALGPDERNALVFVGYQADGTLGAAYPEGMARDSRSDGRETIVINLEIATTDGVLRPLRPETADELRRPTFSRAPEKIFTIHGDENKTIDLASSIYKRYRIETHSPMNLETYRMI